MQYTERQRRDAYNYLHAPTEESIWGGTTQPIVDLVNRSFQPGDVLFELSCGDFRMAPVLLHIPGTTVIGTDIIY
ncbi:hypothetical protein HY468_00195, partial [Candidatus Roizmanbacteria bacterium]|nr:hypothetical protein [Candidatus Roizmanbacteria bacterium]